MTIATLSASDSADLREVLTPEGIPLRFEVASISDRLVAFLYDATLIVLGLAGLSLFAGLVFDASTAGAVAALGAFLLRSFYFIWFELRWQGATPGKRWAGIRVIDWRGGPFNAEAVFARNLGREVELFGAMVLLDPFEHGGSVGALLRLLGGLWTLGFLLMPLFNRDHRRVGDLVAGTLVVVAPKARLLPDLSDGGYVLRKRPRGKFRFTDAHLSFYGIYELQVLEDLLRRDGVERRKPMRAVVDKIRAKIGWDTPVVPGDVELFLNEFYAAQRAHLEQRMLLGERRDKKR